MAVISALVVEWVVIVVEFIVHLFLVIAAILVSLTREWPLLHMSAFRAVHCTVCSKVC